ncbi:DMT family transporter [Pseudorhodobacter ferrugineus]|uniref:DMT family transporter n=1 Tax=Pseudorhodobacter ferrugineus TaxID=77008 RepID=UPI0003B4D68C|nr:DMT family transporter [Pseudorhodobacter ferrugineus]
MTMKQTKVPRLGNNGAGILFMLLAIFCFTLMDANVKGVVDRYPAPMLVWIRFLGQLILVLILLRHRFFAHLRSQYITVHFARAVTQIGATALFFTSLAYIGLAEATALIDVNPVLITLGAAIFLGERLGPRRLFGVFAALCGALIILRPGTGLFSLAALLPLAGAVCYAANALITRWIGPKESAWTSMAFTSVICTGLASLSLPFVWVPIASDDLPTFALIGVLGTVAQLCIIRAFTLAEAASVAPFAYVGIIFAAGWGILFFDIYPDRWTVIGALVIVAAGLYVWHRETRALRDNPTG